MPIVNTRAPLRTGVPPEYGGSTACLRHGEAVAPGAPFADQSAGIANRTNHASSGIFQQQSFLIGVSSADRIHANKLSEDLVAVDGSTTKPHPGMTRRRGGRGATRFHVLVSQTLIEPPTLSRYLKDLKSMSYVTRTSSSVDARGVLITPTKKALDLVEKLTPHAFQVEQETLAGLTEDEAELFRRLVKRVCGHLAPFAADKEGKD